MLNFEWTEAHAIHLPAFDGEHQRLFQLCQDLARAVLAPGTAEVQPLAAELLMNAAQHFTHEECEMRATAYPLYDWHRHSHQAARARVRAFGRRIREGDQEAALELLDYLSVWLSDHVRLADRMFGAYARNYRRARGTTASSGKSIPGTGGQLSGGGISRVEVKK